MQPPAFVRPLRPTMLRALRVLTRLALTALVLTLTFGGTTGAPAEAPLASAPQLRPVPVAVVPQPTVRPVSAPVSSRPVGDRCDTGQPPVCPIDDLGTAPRVGTLLPPPAADPGQRLPGRRAPPRT
ncbi:hypothetical protein [Micromonospora inyonensis]|uniref:Uncharacterized protein n=1 Tax=Micromonospora inyonensis TaxID=47866 RepID=A0A1C6RJB9_9ACTN|nr:hypothetical protein [Micromonospora inyonensis]SCL17296.1 hypothetical protein GA0074694_1954 [Micromonospora inyonensis]